MSLGSFFNGGTVFPGNSGFFGEHFPSHESIHAPRHLTNQNAIGAWNDALRAFAPHWFTTFIITIVTTITYHLSI
jgi:hypothetical protein